MKKFKFKLEAVLTERKRAEDFKLREWMLARRVLIGLIEELGELEKKLKSVIHESDDLQEASTNVGLILNAHNFIEATKLRMVWKRREIERAMKVSEKKRLEYVFASQKRAALDKMKDKKNEEFKEQIRHRELKLLDDIYIMRARAHSLHLDSDIDADADTDAGDLK